MKYSETDQWPMGDTVCRHPDFVAGGTVSGRFSSTEPNVSEHARPAMTVTDLLTEARDYLTQPGRNFRNVSKALVHATNKDRKEDAAFDRYLEARMTVHAVVLSAGYEHLMDFSRDPGLTFEDVMEVVTVAIEDSCLTPLPESV